MFESAERISETRRRKKPESSTTRTLTAITAPMNPPEAPLGHRAWCCAWQRRSAYLHRVNATLPAAITSGLMHAPSDTTRVTLEHAWHIQDQSDTPVTGDSSPRHSGCALQHFAQGLDYHLLLAHQLIDDKADTLGAHGENHHMAFVLLFVLGTADQPALEVEQRQRLVTHNHHFLAVHHVGARQVEVEDFVDVDQREGKGLVAQHHHQGRHDGQGQRHLDDNLGALALGRVDIDDAVELGNLGFHHVHAHTATGHVGDLGLGREARGKNQVVALGFAEAVGGVLVQHALLHRLGAQYVRVHAVTVVGDRQQDMVAFLL